MYNMFMEMHGNNHKVSHETYRTIFTKYFNISFGYPRSDTCSICDEYVAKAKAMQAQKSNLLAGNEFELNKINSELQNLDLQNKVHRIKAEEFYKRKKSAKLASRKDKSREAICIDFAKNLPVPNITTNGVYYKRQLSVYSFNIHELASARSIFFVYPETIGSKGSDSVCSFLHHYLYNLLDPGVKHLHIFCDSCGGHNKNYTMFRYIHHIVHTQQKFESITISFPIRGHSYMECDKDFGLIKQKSRAELPHEWAEVFRGARVRPNPFDVVEVTQDFFRSWSTYFSSQFKKQCPFKTRPIREIRVAKKLPGLVYYRDSWNGMWNSSVIVDVRKKKKVKSEIGAEFELPGHSYKGLIPLSNEKYKDLQSLIPFCMNLQARDYFSTLPHNHKAEQEVQGGQEKEGEIPEQEGRKNYNLPTRKGSRATKKTSKNSTKDGKRQ